MAFTYEFPRPALTVDVVVFALQNDQLKILLIQRKFEPCSGSWAFPGGFVDENEPLEQAARRELNEETGIENLYLEQLYTFGDPGRDPRGHTISVSYLGLIRQEQMCAQARSDAQSVDWFSLEEVPELAFDHNDMLKIAVERLSNKIRYEPLIFELLDKKFTLPELQNSYEIILGSPLDKRNFRRKIIGMDILDQVNEFQTDVAHRAAMFYKFNPQRFVELRKNGLRFEI